MTQMETPGSAIRRIVEALDRRGSATALVGVDGPGGAGKSTFARRLAEAVGTASAIVGMDDFYLAPGERTGARLASPGGAFDWERLLAEVLRPLSEERDASYRPHDWETARSRERVHVEPGRLVVVEGVSALRRELHGFYDYRVFVECPRALRLERGLARDGEEARARWVEEWMPAEDLYLSEHLPMERADVVVDGRVE